MKTHKLIEAVIKFSVVLVIGITIGLVQGTRWHNQKMDEMERSLSALQVVIDARKTCS